jgi:hypothetical protein
MRWLTTPSGRVNLPSSRGQAAGVSAGRKIEWVELAGSPVSVVGAVTPVGARMVELEGMVSTVVAVEVVGTSTDTDTVTFWVLVTIWVLIMVIFDSGLVATFESELVVIGKRVVPEQAWDAPLVDA